MPLEIPNKDLFKPFYPTITRPHSLFGQKYFQHEFQSIKWKRSSQKDQLKAMIRVLGKNLEFQQLEENRRNEKAENNLRNLRVECQEKRQEVKASIKGDVQSVRNILIEHTEMRRLYQKQDISLANDNIQQRIFIKRKENDRLKYKMNLLQDKYKNLLIEQSRLEDRFKYGQSQQPEDIKASQLRPILDNSQTRVRAFKMINQCYKNMIDTLRKDELHYQPVLDSLEEDLSEQSKLIQHVILLAIPAKKKYLRLIQEYNKKEEETRTEIKRNLETLKEYKEYVKDDRKEVTNVVNERIESYDPPRKYVWNTTSMCELNEKRQTLYEIIKVLQVATVSSDPEEIFERVKCSESDMGKDVILLNGHIKNLKLLKETELRAKALINEICYHSDIKDNTGTLNELNSKIKDQKNIRERCNDEIRFTGVIITRLYSALSNITEVMRHVGNERKKVRPKYPNDQLSLPLLKFNLIPKHVRPRPYIYNDRDHELFKFVKAKIKLLRLYHHKENPRAIQMYCNVYVDYVRKKYHQDNIGKIIPQRPVIDFEDRPCQDIRCRSDIKARSAQIVEAGMIKRQFM